MLKFPISAFRRLDSHCAVADDAVMPSHLPMPHPLEKFLFKKENDNACELKVNGIAEGTSNAKNRDIYCVFLTMEMNERGYKIKGPH